MKMPSTMHLLSMGEKEKKHEKYMKEKKKLV